MSDTLISCLGNLQGGLAAAAPGADPSLWLGPLTDALTACNAVTVNRAAAFLGQCVGEAGPALSEMDEDLYYTHAARLMAVWPSRFASEADATPYLCSPEKLANKVYSGKLGNGDEASGDGWHFRGGGLLQLTGRATYAAYALARGLSAEDAADRTRTPEGAADSAAWYWQAHGLNVLADRWQITLITRSVNGVACLGNAERIAASNAAQKGLVS